MNTNGEYLVLVQEGSLAGQEPALPMQTMKTLLPLLTALGFAFVAAAAPWHTLARQPAEWFAVRNAFVSPPMCSPGSQPMDSADQSRHNSAAER